MESQKQPAQPWQNIQTRQHNIASQHYAQYQEMTLKARKKCHHDKMLKQEHVIDCKKILDQNFKLTIKLQQQQNQVYVLEINMRGIQFELGVLFIDQNSPLSKIKADQKGAHGSVYTFTLLDHQIAIKSYHLENISSLWTWVHSQAVHRVVKQYLISRLSSHYQSGPYMKNWLGFDLIVFNNTIQFAMEKCEPIISFSETDYESLLQSLVNLHSNKIVHNDITTDNIMFSPTYNKPVFIDYGFSEVIEQQIGFKTLTSFQGTANFVSKQMLALFSVEDKQDYVDLYCNDMVCFQNSSEDMRKKVQKDQNICLNLLKDPLQQLSDSSSNSINGDVIGKSEHYYLFIILSYCVYFEPNRVVQILNYKKRLLIRLFPRKILKLFAKKLPSKLYEKILFDELYCLRNLDEFTDLCKLIRIRKVYSLNNNDIQCTESMISIDQIDSKQINFIKQELGIQYLDGEGKKLLFKQFPKYALRQDFYNLCENKVIYFAIVFEQLRFDYDRNQMNEKKEIAKKVLHFMNEQNQSQDPLLLIRKTFKVMLRELIKKQSNLYHCTFVSNLITQSVFIQADILEQIDLLLQYLKSNKHSFQVYINYLSIFFYCLRFMDLKYFFLEPSLKQKMENSLTKCMKSLQFYMLSSCFYYSSFEDKTQKQLIFQILSVLFQDSHKDWRQIDDLALKISKISHQAISVKLMKFRIYRLVQLLRHSTNDIHRKTNARKIIQQFAHNRQLQKCQTFFEQIYWKYSLSFENDNVLQRLHLFKKYCYIIRKFPQFSAIFIFLQIFIINFNLFTNVQGLINIALNFANGCFKNKRIHLFQGPLKCMVEIIESKPQFRSIRTEIIPLIIKKWIEQIENQVYSIINELQLNLEPESFSLQNNYFDFTFRVAQRALNMVDKKMGRIFIDKLHEIMDYLYAKLLQIKARKGIQAYTAYLFYQYYRFVMVTLNQPQVYIQLLSYLKLQIYLIQKLPKNIKIQVMYLVFQVLEYSQRNRAPEYNKSLNQQIYFIKKAVQYCWRYCSVYNDWGVYFDLAEGTAIKTTFSMFMQDLSPNSQKCLYFFMKSINEYLVYHPIHSYIKYFQQNISLLYLQYPHLFSASKINSYNFSTTWYSRFVLLYYALCLDQEKDQNKQLELLVKIAKGMFLHSWQSRELIQFLCIRKTLKMKKLFMDTPRKCRYVIRRYALILNPLYGNLFGFQKEQYAKRMIRFHRLKNSKINSFRKILKNKLLKLN